MRDLAGEGSAAVRDLAGEGSAAVRDLARGCLLTYTNTRRFY